MTSLGVTPLPPLLTPPPPPNTDERDRDLTRLSRLTGPPPSNTGGKVPGKVQAKELVIGVLVGLLLLFGVFGVVYAVRKAKNSKSAPPRSAAFFVPDTDGPPAFAGSNL